MSPSRKKQLLPIFFDYQARLVNSFKFEPTVDEKVCNLFFHLFYVIGINELFLHPQATEFCTNLLLKAYSANLELALLENKCPPLDCKINCELFTCSLCFTWFQHFTHFWQTLSDVRIQKYILCIVVLHFKEEDEEFVQHVFANSLQVFTKFLAKEFYSVLHFPNPDGFDEELLDLLNCTLMQKFTGRERETLENSILDNGIQYLRRNIELNPRVTQVIPTINFTMKDCMNLKKTCQFKEKKMTKQQNRYSEI